MVERRPWVTWSYAVACVLVSWLVTGFFPTDATLEPVAWSREAWDEGAWERLVFATFAHAGLFHLVFNLLTLVALGAVVEPHIGSVRYGALLLVAGVVGNLAHATFYATPVVGASGAIFGIIGVLLALFPSERVVVILFRVPVAIAAAFYAAAVFLVPSFTAAAPIAHAAHLGGLGAGALLAAGFDPRAAVRHAPWVAAIFLLAFAAVAWMRANDLLRVGTIWRAEGALGVLGFLWIPVACSIGIGASLAVLESQGERAEAGA
ncbi:MAG TPA: rhomboid family intramembrane serine protease [Candidatus Thermoplasmatota archaeon]|nr:rhomboid family intramembrane serine protease [Candidatus Thermoplasmatota archaeon]